RDRELQAAALHPRELRRREAVLVHRAARVLEPHEHLVVVASDLEHRGDLLAERRRRGRAEIPLEIEHEEPRPRGLVLALRALLALAFLLPRLRFLAVALPAQDHAAQR